MDTSPGIAVDLPPGPRGWLRPTIRLIREPVVALREWGEKFGPTFTVRQLGQRIVMTSDPELVQQIYAVRDPELFGSIVPESLDVLIGPQSIGLLVGEQHQRQRKLLQPAFHGDRMRGWARRMVAAARRAFAGPDLDGAPVLERTRRATLEVIIALVFGVDEQPRVAEFEAVVLEWISAIRPGFLFVRALQRDLLGVSPFARYHRASRRLDELLFEHIARMRSDPRERDDVLSSLLAARYDDGTGMSDAAIRDQLRSLLFAGHDTTAVVLAWALYFVAIAPEVRARLLAELDPLDGEANPEVYGRLPYLGAVVDETLRIRPVTTDVIRLLRKPWQLGPWRLPEGSAVAPIAPLMHFRADLWPEPDRFVPDRFLAERPSPNIYFPFGGGARRCVGASFARLEACVILATLLREYEFVGPEASVEWNRRAFILEPIGGVPMRVRPRRAQGGGGSGTTPLRV
ncbi:cytochrome P450 [Nannocystaceae bacterium ST9]